MSEAMIDQILGDPEFENMFNARCTEGVLDIEHASDVLSDWSIHLAHDLEPALRYYGKDSPIPAEQLSDKLDFDGFVLILQQYFSDQETPQDDHNQKIGGNEIEAYNDNMGPVAAGPIMDLDGITKILFEEQEDQTEKAFREYASLSDSGQDISKTELVLLIKNLLNKHGITLKFEENIDSYFPDEIDYSSFRSGFMAFLRDNPQEDDHQEQVSQALTQRPLEEDILNQIEKYQSLLQQTESELEKQVLRNMITTLVKQVDMIRESSMRVDQTQTTQKKKLQISFSGIARPEKRARTKEELEVNSINKRLSEIFLFFCKQQYVNGVTYDFDRYTKEAQCLSLGMFLYFCNSFNLIAPRIRETKDKHLLERKKRGEEIIIPDVKKKPLKLVKQKQLIPSIPEDPQENNEEGQSPKQENQEPQPKVEIQEPKLVPEEQQNKERKIEFNARKNKYPNIGSKFEWWNDELNFEKYYKPSGQENKQYPDDLKFLDREAIRSLFKRTSLRKDLDFEEFKCLLGFMANKMFQGHAHSYRRLLELLYIDYPEEYRQRLMPIKIPFNCKEKLGFRDIPGYEHHKCKNSNILDKTHILTPQEKEQLAKVKADREVYLREKISESVNTSIRSTLSMGKIDKVSWAKLESQNQSKFKPQDLIDDLEDEEDHFYLKEFSIEEEKKVHHPKPDEVKKMIENYGVIKPIKRQYQVMSQPNLLHKQDNQRYSQDIKKQYLVRAGQIQKQQNQRELQLLNSMNHRSHKL